ncbi:MAG: DUF2169 domain-containing protein, partial [Planctomycetaceae bacterium]|nr:DUF2169 domain-containing protein [Planctomycetaceae bacterium]
MDLLNETPLQPGWLILPLPGRSYGAAFAVKGTYQLQPDSPAIPAETPEALEGDVPEAEGSAALRYTRDLTAPKPAVDLLFAGEAYAPGAKPTDMMPVTVQVGTWAKTLAVLGDRRKTKGLLLSKISDPLPFTRMPLTWSRAWGGVESTQNPAGRGLDVEIDEKGAVFTRLPNIVRLGEAGLDPGALKEPAGFGPVSPAWEARDAIARRAHYGAKWLKERWPAPPEDFDPDFFQAAPADQRLASGNLRGDEAITFHNLHPARARYRSALPGLRPRLFIEEQDPSHKEAPVLFREVPLRIDTLWADPSADKLILIWRGFSPVRSMKLREISAILVAQEPLGQAPAPAETYQALLARKRAERAAAAAAPPPAPPAFEPLEIAAPDSSMEALEKEWEADHASRMAELDALVKETDNETRGAAAAALASEGLPTAIVHSTPPSDPASIAAQAAKDHQAITTLNPDAAKLLSQPPTEAMLDAEGKVQAEIDAFEKDFALPFFPPGPDAPPG